MIKSKEIIMRWKFNDIKYMLCYCISGYLRTFHYIMKEKRLHKPQIMTAISNKSSSHIITTSNVKKLYSCNWYAVLHDHIFVHQIISIFKFQLAYEACKLVNCQYCTIAIYVSRTQSKIQWKDLIRLKIPLII